MGIAFDIEKVHEEHISAPLQERRRVEGNRKAVEATEHLNTAIDTLINTERLFEEAGLIVEKNFFTRTRVHVERVRDGLAGAIPL